MSAYPALRRLRVGCVQYLNARPLIDAWPGEMALQHPAVLAEKLCAGELDVALVPSFELFAQPESYYAVDGVAIASLGPVYSVYLAYRGALDDVRTVALDPASRSSAHLAHCLLDRFHQRQIEYVSDPETADARVLIGNQAIRFRQAADPEWSFLDFGGEWTRLTGLPFVYALWLIREDTPGARAAAAELRELRAEGESRIEAIAAAEGEFTESFRREYLTRYIRYGFGPEEKSGLFEFGRILREIGLVPPQNLRPVFI